MVAYTPKSFRGGMIKLSKHNHHAIITSIDDDNDYGWMERFVIDTEDTLQASNLLSLNLGTSLVRFLNIPLSMR